MNPEIVFCGGELIHCTNRGRVRVRVRGGERIQCTSTSRHPPSTLCLLDTVRGKGTYDTCMHGRVDRLGLGVGVYMGGGIEYACMV